MNLFRLLGLFCSGAMALQLLGADNKPAMSMEEIQTLRQKIAEQQKQIDQLQKSVAEQQAILDRALKTMAAERASQPAEKASRSPLSVKVGNADFTPLGFVDFTYVHRSTNVGSSIGTNFAEIPYSNSASGRVGENTLSTQNSRIGFRVDSTVKGAKLLGYLEADFLGNQPGNVFVTSNADTLRLRNFFVDVKKGPLELTGGQDWSLMTPGTVGISPLPSDIFYSQNMDTNYQLGLVWTRQSQFRIAYHSNENWHLAFSIENPQQYIGGGSGAPLITYPSAFASNTGITNQFNNGANSYSVPNATPDFVFKAAYDAKPRGLTQHVEVAGLLRHFRYFNPMVNQGLGSAFSATGGAGSVNANFEVFKHFHLIANTFFSDGGGRYIFGMAPDLILRPNGNISLIHSYSTVDGFETSVRRNLLLYGYYGGAYIGKNAAIDSNGAIVAYGYSGASALTAATQNRSLQELTIGLTPTIWQSPQYGALKLITQYSYVWRNPWYLAPGNPKNAKTNMVFVDLRYILP